MANPKVRQFAGDFRLWRKANNGTLTPVIPEAADPLGNQPVEANAAAFAYEAGDTIEVKSKQTGSRYNQPIYSDTLPGTTTLNLTLLEIPTAILARILYGEASDASVSAGSVTDDPVTVADITAPVQLDHRYLLSSPAPVVKKGAATLVEGTDYKLDRRRGQLVALAGGDIVNEDELLLSYSYPAVTATRILGGATPTEKFYITGDLEDRISGERGELEVFEANMTVDGEVDWLASEPISPVLTGALLVPAGAPAPYVFTAYELAA